MTTLQWIAPEKSFLDEREYCVFTLPNGLQVTTISDPTALKAACALDVGVGSFSDPEYVQGLAHFLEHMLFLGTEKFPDESMYSAFLSKNGGSSNAYTSMENTNYYFDVKAECLEDVLDQFSQFFISPLFTESATGREMNAVQSEHSKNIQNDAWRSFQMYKNAMDPTHPLGRFATGNLETLRDDPVKHGLTTRGELLAFHAKYYSANIMKVCIIGKEDSAVLRDWAVKYFGPIENKNIPKPSFPVCKVRDEAVAGIFRVIPVQERRSLRVIWPLAPDMEYYKSGPLSLFAHLIGYEGQGSILELLKKQGLATGLSAGASNTCSVTAPFTVTVELTETGVDRYENVLDCIFSYLDVLRHASDDEWKLHHKEHAAIAEMNFRYKAKEQSFHYSSQIASNMQLYEPQDVVCGGEVFRAFDLAILRDYVSHMTAKNSFVLLLSPSFQESFRLSTGTGADAKKLIVHTDPYYETKYAIEQMTPARIAELTSCSSQEDLHLPNPNPFIPECFEVFASEQKGDEKPSPADMEAFKLSEKAAGDKLALSRVPPVRVMFDKEGSIIHECVASIANYEKYLEDLDCVKDVDELPEIFHSPTEMSDKMKGEDENEDENGDKNEDEDDDDDNTQLVSSTTTGEEARLYYKLDRCHSQPKVNVMINLDSPVAYGSVRAHVLTTLYTKIITDALTPVAYDAEVAGLRFDITSTAAGLLISVCGYNDKLENLAKVIFERITTETFDQERFTMQLKDLAKSYRNSFKADAYIQNRYLDTVAKNRPMFHNKDKLMEMDTITCEELQAFYPSLYDHTKLSVLVHGNLQKHDAISMTLLAKKYLQKRRLLLSEAIIQRSIAAPVGTTWVRARNGNPKDPESAVSVSYFVGNGDAVQSALAELVIQCIQDKAFDTLRTNEQLGYIVWSYFRSSNNALYVTFTVQSSKSPMYVDSRIESFISARAASFIEEMTDEDFADYKIAVLTSKNELDNSMDSETGRHWAALSSHIDDFENIKTQCTAIENFTKKDVVQFVKRFIMPNPQRCKFSVHTYSSAVKYPSKYEMMEPEDASLAKAPAYEPFTYQNFRIVTPATIEEFKARQSLVNPY